MGRVRNTHGALFSEFKDYAEFADNALQNLDVPSLWSAGAALSDMVEALARVQSGVMAEQLEPDILSQLRSLLRDHTAFVLGFAQGQDLAARAAQLRLLDVEPTELASRARGVLRPMLGVSHLLANRARTLVRALDRALDVGDDKTLALTEAAVATATRSIIAFGDPNAEALRAAISYIVHNANALAAFASHDAELRRWLDWVISEIRRNLPSKE